MTQNKSLNIGIVCGEYSGDMLGAGIIQEIKKYSNVNLFGVGGPKLEELESNQSLTFLNYNYGTNRSAAKIKKIKKKLRNNLIKFFIEKKGFLIGIVLRF